MSTPSLDDLLAYVSQPCPNTVLILGDSQTCEPLRHLLHSRFSSVRVSPAIPQGADDEARNGDWQLAVLMEPDVSQVEQALSAAQPFASILVLGPVNRGKTDINFYATVHSKNLQVLFAPIDRPPVEIT